MTQAALELRATPQLQFFKEPTSGANSRHYPLSLQLQLGTTAAWYM
jgi:hypothetical protein